jgi:hypothetical protein
LDYKVRLKFGWRNLIQFVMKEESDNTDGVMARRAEIPKLGCWSLRWYWAGRAFIWLITTGLRQISMA